MTYESSEQSVASGKPVEFYEFADPDGTRYRITSASTEQEYMSHTYYPEPCKRSEHKMTGSAKKNSMTFTLGYNNAFAMQYVAGPREGKATVIVYRGHEGNVVTFWRGIVSSVKFDKNWIPTVRADPAISGVVSKGKRRKFQRLCDHSLYGAACGVNSESFKVEGTIDSISGLVITSTTLGTKANGWFKAGKIVVGNVSRMITDHTGNDVTITRTIPGMLAGDNLRAYAGCDRTPTTCDTIFSNKINFGGDEHLPNRNPFTGDPIV